MFNINVQLRLRHCPVSTNINNPAVGIEPFDVASVLSSFVSCVFARRWCSFCDDYRSVNTFLETTYGLVRE